MFSDSQKRPPLPDLPNKVAFIIDIFILTLFKLLFICVIII
jgi:hypothetical protein